MELNLYVTKTSPNSMKIQLMVYTQILRMFLNLIVPFQFVVDGIEALSMLSMPDNVFLQH